MQLGSLQEVITEYVRDGQSIALEGFTHLIPFAAGHEILRQKKRDLHLIRMTPDLIYDQLIGAGCARELTFSWGGNPGVGSLHLSLIHISEPTRQAEISYAVFCLKKKKQIKRNSLAAPLAELGNPHSTRIEQTVS